MARKRCRTSTPAVDKNGGMAHVLRFLPRQSLSSMAQCSRAWHDLVHRYFCLMQEDLSGGLELSLAIRVVNTVDSERYPQGFVYQTSTASIGGVNLPPPLERHVPVEVFKHHRTGWSVRATTAIGSVDSFIGEYVGRIVRTATMDRTSRYIVSIREEDKDSGGMIWRTNVDARDVGNFTRFINHSCMPNARWDTYRSPTSFCPRIHVMSLRAIDAGEEITVDYGAAAGVGTTRCHCGTATCRGFLPFDSTL